MPRKDLTFVRDRQLKLQRLPAKNRPDEEEGDELEFSKGAYHRRGGGVFGCLRWLALLWVGRRCRTTPSEGVRPIAAEREDLATSIATLDQQSSLLLCALPDSSQGFAVEPTVAAWGAEKGTEDVANVHARA